METNSIISQIGNTPLVKLKQASEYTGCNIYGKAEYFNPGESVKDRAALFIVQDALKRKLISIKKTSNFMNILSKYCFRHKLLKVSGIKFFRNISYRCWVIYNFYFTFNKI